MIIFINMKLNTSIARSKKKNNAKKQTTRKRTISMLHDEYKALLLVVS